MDSVYVNGKLLPSQDVRIALDDRAFRFGDGVFETIAIHNAKPYQLALHMRRLEAGLAALGISAKPDIPHICDTLISASSMRQGFVRIIVSRGAGSVGYRSTSTQADIYAQYVPCGTDSPSTITLGLAELRKIAGNMLPAGHKLNAHGLNSSLAQSHAQKEGAQEALQLDKEGHISEASSGNIFWLSQGKLHTPALQCDCLNGTTRAAIMRLSHVPVEEVALPLEALEKAEAVFVTNCNWGVLCVDKLLPFGWEWNTHHKDIHTLRHAYAADIATHCA